MERNTEENGHMLMDALLRPLKSRGLSFVLLFGIFSHCLSYHIPDSCSEYCSLSELESQDPRMVWVGKDLIDHLVPTPLPWAGPSATRPGCSKPCPILLRNV